MLRSDASSNSTTRSQNNERMMRQNTINRHNQARKAPARLAPKLETHSSIERLLSSSYTGTTSSSTTHAVLLDSSMIVSPTLHQHSSLYITAHALQQQLSPHVLPYSHSQTHFLEYANQELSQASFVHPQMPYSQHQSTTSTPDATSLDIEQSSS